MVPPLNELIPLHRLRKGEIAEIRQVTGQVEQVHRLHELGLGDGAEVEMVQSGSPCIIRLGSKKICFRATDILGVLVRPGVTA